MDGDLEAIEFHPEDTAADPDPVSRPRGFSDPEVLARAQATRAANREAGRPIAPPDGEGDVKPKRGRPKGSMNKSSPNTKGLEMLLIAVHSGIGKLVSYLSDEPEIGDVLTIDGDEAKILAVALAECGERYKIRISEKYAALILLCNALGVVYGPRAIAIGFMVRNKRNARTAPDA